jgi:hypothetical protein
MKTMKILAAVLMVATALVASNAFAIEKYSGDVVGRCLNESGFASNVMATIGGGSPNWFVTGLTYTFSPAPTSVTTHDSSNGKIRFFNITPPGTYTVTVTNPGPQAKYQVVVASCAPAKKGLTWIKAGVDPVNGAVRIACNNNCNATQGDTPCTTPLPLLCIRKSGPGFPLPVPVGMNNSDQYNRWAGGVIATTAPMVPPATLAAANAVCATTFGANWRLAEFHDGWGWAFRAYGGVGDPNQRVWLDINDQPGATCW